MGSVLILLLLFGCTTAPVKEEKQPQQQQPQQRSQEKDPRLEWIKDYSGHTPDRLLLDGTELQAENDLYLLHRDTHAMYLDFEKMGQALGIETVSAVNAPIEKNGVVVPQGSLAVFFDGGISQMTLGSDYIVSHRNGEEQLAFCRRTAVPVLLGGAYYIDPAVLPWLFFVRMDTESAYEENVMQLQSLDHAVAQAEAYAKTCGFVFEATGDPMYDCYIFGGEIIAKTEDGTAAAVFWPESDQMMMGPVLGDLQRTDFGYLRSMKDAAGKTKYGLYIQPFGNESLPVAYDEIIQLDAEDGLFQLKQGDHYFGMHCPRGQDAVMLLDVGGDTPLTAEELRHAVRSRGIDTRGEWDSQVYLNVRYTTDFTDNAAAEDAADRATLWWRHPIYWSMEGQAVYDLEGRPVSVEEGVSKARWGTMTVIDPDHFAACKETFYAILYPEEQESVQEHQQWQHGDAVIFRYTLQSEGGMGSQHFFVYLPDSGVLCDITFYSSAVEDDYESAVFQRVVESISFDGLWHS